MTDAELRTRLDKAAKLFAKCYVDRNAPIWRLMLDDLSVLFEASDPGRGAYGDCKPEDLALAETVFNALPALLSRLSAAEARAEAAIKAGRELVADCRYHLTKYRPGPLEHFEAALATLDGGDQ